MVVQSAVAGRYKAKLGKGRVYDVSRLALPLVGITRHATTIENRLYKLGTRMNRDKYHEKSIRVTSFVGKSIKVCS
jgi:hypothetical protein